MILDKLAQSTEKRVEQGKKNIPLEVVKKQALDMPKGNFEFEKALAKSGINFICEVKKASPSKGIIAEKFPYVDIAKEYEKAGASCISVLTEPEYFKGDKKYLKEISENVSIPLIRKDFVIDEYMIYDGKIHGASCVLLICSLLDEDTIRKYIEICDSLGMSALVEAHDEEEVKKAIKSGARIIGVNNRDLRDFSVDLNTTLKLRDMVDDDVIFVSESGIKTREDIELLEKHRVNAVLIGETMMKSHDKRHTLEVLKGIDEED